MPVFPPRNLPIKKQEELSKREFELFEAIKRNIPEEKLEKIVEKYRKAQLSLLKAKIHSAKEKQYQKHTHNFQFDKLETDIENWKNKNVEQIVMKFKMQNKI